MACKLRILSKNIKQSSAIGTIGFSVLLWVLLIGAPFAFLYSRDVLFNVLVVCQLAVAVIILYCFIKSLEKLIKLPNKSVHTVVKIFALIIMIMCNFLAWNLLESESLQTVETVSVNSKYSEKSNHFISLENQEFCTKIPVDEKTYNALIVDKNVKYKIEYRTIKWSSKGILEKPIDTTTFIDNRTVQNRKKH